MDSYTAIYYREDKTVALFDAGWISAYGTFVEFGKHVVASSESPPKYWSKEYTLITWAEYSKKHNLEIGEVLREVSKSAR